METDDFDPRDDPTPTARVAFGSPHFARLVRSPAARRVSPRRLILAAGLGSTLAWGLYTLGAKAAGALARFVADQPEHRIAFDAIELVPPPPPYIRSGSAAILDSVRQDGRFDSTLSVPALDLESLRAALKLNHWIEEVVAVRSSYRRVTAEVAYRRPLALILHPAAGKGKGIGDVVDRNGVVMPGWPDFDWAEKTSHRPTPEGPPLIEVWGLGVGIEERVGYTWKPANPAIPEARVEQAIRLAEFLADRVGATTPGGRPYPPFVKIHYQTEATPVGELAGFFLRDERGNWVLWGSGPGAEEATEVAAGTKWRMLGQFVDQRGSLEIGGGPRDHLKFTPKGAEVWRSTDRPTSGGQSGR